MPRADCQRRGRLSTQGLSAASLEEVWAGSSRGALGAGSGAATAPGPGGRAGSERGWVGSGLGEAGAEACRGRLVTPQGSSHQSVVLAGRRQTSSSAGRSSHITRLQGKPPAGALCFNTTFNSTGW